MILLLIFLTLQLSNAWYKPSTTVEQTCDLQRIHASELMGQAGRNQLVAFLRSVDAPVIIEGAVDGWAALESWKDRDHFLFKYGDIPISDQMLVNRSLDVAQDGPNTLRTTYSGSTLGNYIRIMTSQSKEESVAYSRSFLFQRTEPTLSIVGELMDELIPPGKQSSHKGRKLKDGVQPEFIPPLLSSLGIVDWLVASIGGSTGGLPPHKHTASWLALIVGQKSWYFLPPEAMSLEDMGSLELHAQAVLTPPSLWSRELREILRNRTDANGERAGLLECIQGPGEVIFLPHMWWHATDNIGDAIGIGAQYSISFNAALFPRRTYNGCAISLSLACSGGVGREAVLRKWGDTDWRWKPVNGKGGQREGEDESEDEIGVQFCTDDVRLGLARRMAELEPFNVKHILAYASSLIQYPDRYLTNSKRARKQRKSFPTTVPNPVTDALTFLDEKARSVEEQSGKGNISPSDTHKLLGRIGLWIQDVPKLATEHLGADWAPEGDTIDVYTRVLMRIRGVYEALETDEIRASESGGEGIKVLDNGEDGQRNKKRKKKSAKKTKKKNEL